MSQNPAYKRVMLKVSGEALMGDRDYGLDNATCRHIAEDIRGVVDLGVQVCLVIGGGNIFRGISGAASGKPEAIIEKMVEGRIRKYYEEVVLLEQVWVHDGESRVKEVVRKAGLKLSGFARFHLGEGIEKQQGDFAAEVAAAAGKA